MTMTADARRALSTTIGGLRARLLDDLHGATESAWRLSIAGADEAGLGDGDRRQRGRFEDWITEQLRAQGRSHGGATGRGQDQAAGRGKDGRGADDFRREVEKQAAYTLINRLVLLRLMEAPGPGGEALRAPAVVIGGWDSRAYKDFRQIAPEIVRGDDTEGYGFLLQLVFDDLAIDLPGVFGSAGVAELVPIPAATLRHVIDALDAPELASCWTDDMTLGWVYQYWNDPAREALDEKLNAGGKIEPHEVASKTQMFTERYMVEWLLHNSLGPLWLAICARNGWVAEVEADGTLDRLEARRGAWRAARAAGEVELTALMPLETEAERRWCYHLRQPLPVDAAERAVASIRDVQLLDPAVGSGHFLVVALDLLVALYREEAWHRGESGETRWSDRAIVERILSHNLHGIDLDPRAVQIAAAALWLKARQIAPDARPRQLGLVASNLRLASLPDDDPALVELRREVERDTGIPAALTDRIMFALRGADHLGSLLRVDQAVEDAIDRYEGEIGRGELQQGGLFTGYAPQQTRMGFDRSKAQAKVTDRLEAFLAKRTGADDLGLRLRGAQLAAGVRFVQRVRAGRYDIVVANPPYQGTGRLADSAYVEKAYPLGKADLYAAFLLRGLELVKPGGVSAMLTMRNWMFIKQYAELRAHLLETYDLRALGDFEVGAFEEVGGMVVSVCVSTFRRGTQGAHSIAQKLTLDGSDGQAERTQRKRAATLCQDGCHAFKTEALKVVPEWPLVYWWSEDFIQKYDRTPKLAGTARIRQGLATSDNVRRLRRPHELHNSAIVQDYSPSTARRPHAWVPHIMGAAGIKWFDILDRVIDWGWLGLSLKVFHEVKYSSYTKRIPAENVYFTEGIAFATIGSSFSGRIHTYPGTIDTTGCSVYPRDLASVVCLFNSSIARSVLDSLNPTVHYTNGDVERLPLFRLHGSETIVKQLKAAFTHHESHREPSVEYRQPGPSPWEHAQAWAQLAVDRAEGEPLPEYIKKLVPEDPTTHVSHALGVALGRFGPAGEGIVDPKTADLGHALPDGLLFLDGTLASGDHRDGLGHPAAAPLHEAWARHRTAISSKRELRAWLAHDFFKDVHRQMYDNRPIHWPLSSASRTFVAWVNIHRMSAQTLPVLLADHAMPTLARIDGELADLRAARDGIDKPAAREAAKQYGRLEAAREELVGFIAAIEQCADRGAPPSDARCGARAQDARFDPVLDDGVMINSAALWPLLAPQWKDPRKWWKELATGEGRQDYDWSQLAMRYWPDRVDGKCQRDPSLAVAHGCFWRYHPARAWAWELRLQDEIGGGFCIEEGVYRPGGREVGDGGGGWHRAAWVREHGDEAIAAVEREAVRRMGRGGKRRVVASVRLLVGGLWSGHAGAMWAAEDRLAERQGEALRIEAPDEAAGRAAYVAGHPGAEAARAALLAALREAQGQTRLQGMDGDGVDEMDGGDGVDEIDGIGGEEEQ